MCPGDQRAPGGHCFLALAVWPQLLYLKAHNLKCYEGCMYDFMNLLSTRANRTIMHFHAYFIQVLIPSELPTSVPCNAACLLPSDVQICKIMVSHARLWSSTC